jgi:hypothetical protein
MVDVLQPIVHIIESPSPADIARGRCEGEALSAALRLAETANQYHRVDSLHSLKECIVRIAGATKPHTAPEQTETVVSVPHLHFSSHGNANGIGLTNGDFVDWKAMRELLLGFAGLTGLISPRGFGLFPVLFSTCNGASAREMFTEGPPYPCMYIVGPNETVPWSAALTAYVVYYHLNLVRHTPAQSIVAIMNQAAGLGTVFQAIAHHD